MGTEAKAKRSKYDISSSERERSERAQNERHGANGAIVAPKHVRLISV